MPRMSVDQTFRPRARRHRARVKDFPKTGTTFVRLREMGLLAWHRRHFVRTAPLGDPLEIKVRGYHLTLRREEAEQIIDRGLTP